MAHRRTYINKVTDALTPLERALLERNYTLVETHISRVFLGEHAVYKFKRPVNLGFLDFTRSEDRRQACEAEVALNRRLAPDVYLGVLAAYLDSRGEPQFVPAQDAPPHTPCEWAVHMRRLPDEARADHLLSRGALHPADIDAIASMLARFHAEVRADAHTARFGAPDVIEKNVEENFTQVQDTIGTYLSDEEAAELMRFQRTFLRDRAAVFEARARDGKVRDGHGDLRLEHLYRNDDGSFIAIDCIEFNERFRFADVCADLSFLSMDLAHHERPDLAERLVLRYAREAADYGLYQVLDFYQSYRATVRAKVSSMLAVDPAVREAARARAAGEARRYYLLALSAARRPLLPARVIAVSGAIASGKSTIAEALSERLAIPVLSSDRTRKEMLSMAPTAPRHEPSFQGAYGEATTAEVYGELFRRAAYVLESGRSVILDASFRSRAQRAQARALAQAHGVPIVFVECRCPRDVALARLEARARGPSVSDGRAEIYDDFLARFEALEELPAQERCTVDTREPLPANLARVLECLDGVS